MVDTGNFLIPNHSPPQKITHRLSRAIFPHRGLRTTSATLIVMDSAAPRRLPPNGSPTPPTAWNRTS